MVRVSSTGARGELLYQFDCQPGKWAVAIGSRTVSVHPDDLEHATTEEFELLLADQANLQSLVEGGADQSELMVQAVEIGSVDLVKLLISNQCDINIRDSRSFQPLINLAVREKQRDVVKALLDADVLWNDHAFELACHQRDVLTIELLLERNSVNISALWTPQDVLRKKCTTGPIASFGGTDTDNMLNHAVYGQEMSILWHCLSHRRDHEVLTKALTPAHWKAYQGYMDQVSEMYLRVWLKLFLCLGTGECDGWLSHNSFQNETKCAFEEFMNWRREIATLIVVGVRCIE